MIIDSHCHVSPFWYEPVESLLHQMDRCGVGRAVLVQMLGQYDNSYQGSCVTRFPDRLTSVVLVDIAAKDACGQLQRLVDQGASGLRLRPGARSPGEDKLAIWRAASRCGIAISCVGSSAGFADQAFFDLVAALPDLRIVLEHLGGSSRPDADDAERALRRRMFDLAAFDNVSLKMPGLGELANRVGGLTGSPFEPATPELLREAVARFGPARLMWGSDYPPVSSREGYSNALTWVRDALSDQTPHALEMMFGGVASGIFFKRT